ncbi:MAG: ABC transporter permease [Clostridiales bacterium]|nr:ABC transporter permease [Clostridiales bacterium]
MRRFLDFLQRFYLGIIFFFLYAPIFVMIVFSFNNGNDNSTRVWDGFTLEWYQKLFQDDQILSALYTTISVAVIASLAATLLGTLAAIGISDMKKWRKAVVMEASYLPMLTPDIVIGISLMLLFLFISLPMGYFTMLLAHITFCLPYVILSVLPKLRQMDKNIYEAALDLGATPALALRKVLLPQLKPGIITGFLLAFTISLDDFVVSFFTAGAEINNLSMLIYSMARKGVNPSINAVSTLMFLAVLALLLVINMRKKTGNEGRLF